MDKGIEQKFSGTWTNEGCINCQETHCADIELEAKGKNVSGVLSVRNLATDSEWNNLSLSGRRRLWGAKLEIVHVRQGEVSVFGKVKLNLRKDNLRWRLVDGSQDFFPKETTIWKILEVS